MNKHNLTELPMWAQDYIRGLRQERDEAVRERK